MYTEQETEKEALARRAVASKHWKWGSGVSLIDGRLITKGQNNGAVYLIGDRDHTRVDEINGLPDLDDPATLGCLLACVREAWGGYDVGTWQDIKGGNQTAVVQVGLFRDFDGLTLAEALVAALEAAP